MQALTVIPRQAGTIRLQDIEEPAPADGDLLVQTVAIGVCGTDLDIVAGLDRLAPGRRRAAGNRS